MGCGWPDPIIVEPRGDEVKMITEALKYIPTDREDIWSLMCYLREQFKP